MIKLTKALNDTEFNIPVDYNKNSVYYKKRRGSYEFCFVVNYTRGYSDVVEQSRDMPEEFNLNVTFIDVTDLELYKNNSNIELTEAQEQECLDIISNKIINSIN